jgi:hypothetical protein
MKKLILLSLFLIIPLVSAEIVINEIMYNPDGPDDNHEWIEIYNDGSEDVNLTGWKFYEGGTNHGLTLKNGSWILEPNNYAIIADDWDTFLEDWPNFSATLFDSTFSLSNSGEALVLKNSSLDVVENITYNSSWGADGDGDTLQLINNSWCAGDPTPGEPNYCPPPPYFILNFPSHVMTDGTVFLVEAKIFGFEDGLYDIKIDIKDEYGNRTGRIYDINDKEWQSSMYYVYNASLVEDDIGNYVAYMKIDPDKEHIGTATIQGRMRLSGTSSYTDSDLYVFNVVDNIFFSEETNSSLQILDSPSSAEFGEIVKVKINVYRGDTNKYAVYTYIEEQDGTDVSEESTMHFKSKFTNYTLTIPIQLKFNCNEYYDSDDYIIIVEGLGLKAEGEIELSGKSSECLEETSLEEAESEQSAQMDEIIKEITEEDETEKEITAAQITGKTIYVSETSNKARNIIYLILFISTILNIIFIRASR